MAYVLSCSCPFSLVELQKQFCMAQDTQKQFCKVEGEKRNLEITRMLMFPCSSRRRVPLGMELGAPSFADSHGCDVRAPLSFGADLGFAN